VRASKVAFPSASARSLPWGLIPHPSLMIRITGCAIRRRLSHGGLSGYGGHGEPRPPRREERRLSAAHVYTVPERKSADDHPPPTLTCCHHEISEGRRIRRTHRRRRKYTPIKERASCRVTLLFILYIARQARYSAFAGFERRLFSTEIICPAAALFNFVVLFAHACTCTRRCGEKPIKPPPALTSLRRVGLTPRGTAMDGARGRSHGCVPSKQ
jgi:hypothetical protein